MTLPTIEPAQRTAARIAGFLYLLQMATGVGAYYARGRLIVGEDAGQTAQNILAAERLFRLSIAGDLLTYVAVIMLIWALYILLRPVDKNMVFLAVFFRLVENAVLCAATVNALVVLRLLSGVAYLETFEPSQLHSLARVALSAQALGMRVGFIFLGLGSAVFAYLLMKSRYIPRALAAWGIFSSLVLAIVTLALVVLPGLGTLGLIYMLPMGIYEVGVGLWLLVRGVRPPRVA